MNTTPSTAALAGLCDINGKYVRSYATAAKLDQRLSQPDFQGVRFVRVYTATGRHTVIIVGFAQQLLNAGFIQVA